MQDFRLWEPRIRELLHALPAEGLSLAAPPQRPPPISDHLVVEALNRPTIGRHGVIVEVPTYNLPHPFSLYWDGLVHAPPQLLLDGLHLCPHPIATRLPFDQEPASPRLAADEGEAEEVEGLRLAEPAPLAVFFRQASELDQPGLLRMQRQCELLEPFAQRVEEAPGVVLMLEPDDEVVGITHDDHVTRGLAPSVALGPQIEGVVQVDVGKQRRDHRSLRRPLFTDADDPVFQHTRLQPFADQADDALVADPMLDEADQPVLADRIEERAEVG